MADVRETESIEEPCSNVVFVIIFVDGNVTELINGWD